jgi:hypothetical protein
MFAAAIMLLGASAGSPANVPVLHSSAIYVRLDNDAFADRDWGYTSGIKVGFISPTVDSFQDARLPPRLRGFNRRSAWLQPRGFDKYNVSISIGQEMFTPEDWRLSEIDPLDRPYAGVLAAGITYNGRNAQTMRSTTLNVGLVGPSSAARAQRQPRVPRLGASAQRRTGVSRPSPARAQMGFGRRGTNVGRDRPLRRKHRQSDDVR